MSLYRRDFLLYVLVVQDFLLRVVLFHIELSVLRILFFPHTDLPILHGGQVVCALLCKCQVCLFALCRFQDQ